MHSRLAALLLIIVTGPVAGGIVAARALALRQSAAVADARMEGGAAFARAAVDRLSAEARQRLTPAVALEAVREGSSAALGRIRAHAGLDYLVVVSGRSVRGSARPASFASVHVTLALLAGKAERNGLVSDAHVRVVGPPDRVVWGGLFRDGAFLRREVPGPAATVARGVAVAATARGVAGVRLATAGSGVLFGGWRGLCVCSGSPPSGLLLVARPSPVGLLPPLRPASVALLVVALLVGLALPFVLAKMISNPIQRLAADASASLENDLDRLQRQFDGWDGEEAPGGPGPGGDEISRLAETFRALRSGLHQTVGELGGSREELRRTRARLSDQEQLSLSDSLTGAWNRRYLDVALSDAMQRGRRHGHPFAVLMIDIDHFKRINDRFGHTAGDEVLVELCRRIRASLRASLDVLVRYGGEEFVVLLPETATGGATAVAKKLRQVVRSSAFGAAPKPIPVTVSIGVASYPEDGSDTSTVIAAADAKMYRAKRAGRDRVVSSAEEPSRRR